MANLWEQLSKGLADAVADIREKVVEEPMYGRVLNGPETDAPHWPEAKKGQSFGSLEQSREQVPERSDGMDR